MLIKKALRVLKNEGLDVVLYKTRLRFDIKNIYSNWIAGNERNLMYTEELEYNPMFSVVVPVYNVADNMLRECIESILNQTYHNFEIVLVDDCSTQESVRKVLVGYENHDKITVIYRKENGHISRCTNTGIEAAKGEFVALCDCDDLYAPNALYEVAKKLNEDTTYDFIYSDEDKISEDGLVRRDPFFKPDWSPETFMSIMYTCHLAVYRKSVIEQIGGLRVGVEGAQDYDMVLRFMEVTDRIGHVPKILYHWRMRKESTANNLTAKPYIMEATQKSKLDALERRGLKGHLELLADIGQYRVVYEPQNEPLVSIIIPSKDNPDVLFMCLDSIYTKTEYKNFEVIIIDNGSNEENREKISKKTRELGAKYFVEPAEFNFSAMCNSGAAKATGSLLLFLNDDIEITNKEWLSRMAGQAQVSYTGAVGAKLYYPGGKRLQHAGVLNLEIGPGHCLYGSMDNLNYYYGRNLLDYNFTVVTGACLMVDAKKFADVGGFDETLPVAYNDVELCFKLVEAGYYNVLRNDVSCIHHESVSRGLDAQSEAKESRRRAAMAKLYDMHPRFKNGYDPCYNPNLTSDKGDFSFNMNKAMKPVIANVYSNLRDLTEVNEDRIVANVENIAVADDTVRINGWAYDEKKSNNNRNKVKIVLLNETGSAFVLDTTKQYRSDVACAVGRKSGCTLVGFEVIVLKESIPEGRYSVGVIIGKNYVLANKKVEINK